MGLAVRRLLRENGSYRRGNLRVSNQLRQQPYRQLYECLSSQIGIRGLERKFHVAVVRLCSFTMTSTIYSGSNTQFVKIQGTKGTKSIDRMIMSRITKKQTEMDCCTMTMQAL